ncbi:hypothetical protein SAMN05428967_3376 [Phyllobacterium sp. YR620]|nr:hypothetical protein SAMN05428967_3376 [Phyllobacterium sp. YR620]
MRLVPANAVSPTTLHRDFRAYQQPIHYIVGIWFIGTGYSCPRGYSLSFPF